MGPEIGPSALKKFDLATEEYKRIRKGLEFFEGGKLIDNGYTKYLRYHNLLDNKTISQIESCSNTVVYGKWADEKIGMRLKHASRCRRHNHCVICAQMRAVRKGFENYRIIMAVLQENPGYKLVHASRTIRGSHSAWHMVQQLMEFDRKFRSRFRRRKSGLYSQAIGGITAIEPKMGKSTWHFHIHELLIVPKGMETKKLQREMKDNWFQITKGSHQCKVTQPAQGDEESIRRAILYIVKYQIKDQEDFTFSQRFEVAEALKNRNLVIPWGVCRGRQALMDDENYRQVREYMRDTVHSSYTFKYSGSLKKYNLAAFRKLDYTPTFEKADADLVVGLLSKYVTKEDVQSLLDERKEYLSSLSEMKKELFLDLCPWMDDKDFVERMLVNYFNGRWTPDQIHQNLDLLVVKYGPPDGVDYRPAVGS